MTRSKRRGRRGRGAASAQRGRLFGLAMKKIIAWRPQRAAAQSRKRRRRKKFPARRFRPSSRRRRRTRRRTRRRISITFIICASSPDHQKAPPLLRSRHRDRRRRRRRFSSSNSGASVYPHKLRGDVYARQLAHFFCLFFVCFFSSSFLSFVAQDSQVYLSKLCRCCCCCCSVCVRACASLRFAPRAGQMLSLCLSVALIFCFRAKTRVCNLSSRSLSRSFFVQNYYFLTAAERSRKNSQIPDRINS
jgi:hypothetical protein